MSEQRVSVTLNGHAIKDLVSFVCPDEGDTDQLETEVTIDWMPERKSTDGDQLSAGYYAFLTEYPEEGCYGPLGDDSAES